MKEPISKVLLVVGLVFFLQSGFIMSQFEAQARRHRDDAGYAETLISYAEVRTASMVSSAVGSLVGCFGSWLLLVYLKVRRLEQQIIELKGPLEKKSPPE